MFSWTARSSHYIRRRGWRVAPAVAGAAFWALCGPAAPVTGWLSWRGPEQTGVSRETGLPSKVSAQDALWVADFPGQSAPVVAGDRVYAMGYEGAGPDLQEGVACFDVKTGKKLWQHL